VLTIRRRIASRRPGVRDVVCVLCSAVTAGAGGFQYRRTEGPILDSILPLRLGVRLSSEIPLRIQRGDVQCRQEDIPGVAIGCWKSGARC
jgi:hypothetical protein